MIVDTHDPRVSHALEIQAELIEKYLSQNARVPYRLVLAVAPEDDPELVSFATNVESCDWLLGILRRQLPGHIRRDPPGDVAGR